MDLEKANSAIKTASICGLVSALITLIATLVSILNGGLVFGDLRISIFTFFDVALMGGLTVGIYFKSRVCAVLMLVYFLLCKYMQWSAGINFTALVVGIAFIYCFIQGVRGTFSYHALKKKEMAIESTSEA